MKEILKSLLKIRLRNFSSRSIPLNKEFLSNFTQNIIVILARNSKKNYEFLSLILSERC